MNVVSVSIGESFPREVAAVAGGVDHDVSGAGCCTSFEDCLEGGEVAVVFGEGQVVNKENKLERVFCKLFDEGWYQVQLGFFFASMSLSPLFRYSFAIALMVELFPVPASP